MKNERMQPDQNFLQEKNGKDKVLQELKESEENYRLLFENITQGFALHEIILNESGQPIDYRYLTVNPAFEKLTGIKADVIVGKRVLEVMPLLESYWIEAFGKVALTGESMNYENYSAEIGKHFETTVFSPKKGQFAVVFSDISERKHKEESLLQKNNELLTAEEEIRASNEELEATNEALRENLLELQSTEDKLKQDQILLRTIIDSIPDGIYTKDLACRKTIVNLADILNLGAKSESEVLGKNDFEFYPKEIAEKFFADDNLVIQTGNPVINREEFYFDKDGQKQWLLTSKLPLRNLNGQIIGLVGIGRNITKQKQAEDNLLAKNFELLSAEEEIRASNEELVATNDALHENLLELQSAEEKLKQDQILLRTIIDSIPDAIYVKDLNSRKLIANKTDYQNMGFVNEKEAIGKNDFDIWPSEIAQPLFEDDQQVLKHGKSIIDREEKISTPSNQVICLLTTKLPLFDEKGKLKGIVGVGRDITKQKQAEESLLAKNFELLSAEEEIRASNEELAATNDALMENIKELQSAEEEIWATNDKLLAMNEALDQHIKELESAKLEVDEKEMWLRESQRIGRIGSYQLDIIKGEWTSSEVLDEIFGIDETYIKNINGWFSIIHPEYGNEMLQYFEEYVIKGRNLFDKDYKIIRKNDSSVRWLWGRGELTLNQKGKPVQMIGTIQDITEQKEAKQALKESAEFNQSLLQTIPFGMDVVDENGTILFLNEILSNKVGQGALGKKCYNIYSDNKIQCTICPLKKEIKIGETDIVESADLLNGRILQISHTGMIFQGKKAVLEIFQDVTDRKKAQEEILIKNVELQLAEEEIRVANEELISTNIDLHHRMIELKQAKERAEESKKSLQIINQEFEALNQKLENTNLELQAAKENAEEANRLKTSFLHNISHEIRTPLNAIVGFSDLISNREYSREQTQLYNQIIQQGSDQLTAVITDIINIATIEAGQLKIFEKKTDINNIIKNLFSQFLLKVSEKEIDLHYNQLINTDPVIRTDETKVTQILSNLIDNAIKFTDKGRVAYGCHVDGDFLQFYVQDNGIGIEGNLQEKIFERFRQVKSSIDREYGGNGLGLSIAKAYVELLGGKIWLKSEPEKGSIFYFTIPYKRVTV